MRCSFWQKRAGAAARYSPGAGGHLAGRERQKAWQTGTGACQGRCARCFDVLSCPDLFHNLKAAVKRGLHEGSRAGDLCRRLRDHRRDMHAVAEARRTTTPSPTLCAACRQGGIRDPPPHRRRPAVRRDRGPGLPWRRSCQAGQAASEPILRDYAECDRRRRQIFSIAARGMKTGKNQDFLLRALAPVRRL